jgi:hypothetical protein
VSSGAAGKSSKTKLALTGYIALLFCWACLSTFQLFSMHVERWPLCCDFVKLYTAGSLAASGHSVHVYDAKTQFEYCDRLIAPKKTVNGYIQYFPVTFALMVPLTLFSMQTSFVVWSIAGPLLGIFCLWRLLTLWPSTSKSTRIKQLVCLSIGALASEPAYHNAWFGQLAWFYLSILCLAYEAQVQGRLMSLGGWLSLTIIKPQYAIFFLPSLFFKKYLKSLLFFSIGCLVLLALCVIVLGWYNVADFPRGLHFAETEGAELTGLGPEYMVGLRGLLSRALPQQIALPICTIAFLCSVPLVWAIWRRAYKCSNRAAYAWAMSLTIVLSLAVGLHTREYDLLLLLLPAALTLTIPPLAKPNKSWSLWLWTVVLFGFPVISWLVFFGFYFSKLYSPVMTVFVTVLLAAGLWEFFFVGQGYSAIDDL